MKANLSILLHAHSGLSAPEWRVRVCALSSLSVSEHNVFIRSTSRVAHSKAERTRRFRDERYCPLCTPLATRSPPNPLALVMLECYRPRTHAWSPSPEPLPPYLRPPAPLLPNIPHISPQHLPHISPTSPPHLPYTSPIKYLIYISPTSSLHLPPLPPYPRPPPTRLPRRPPPRRPPPHLVRVRVRVRARARLWG